MKGKSLEQNQLKEYPFHSGHSEIGLRKREKLIRREPLLHLVGQVTFVELYFWYYENVSFQAGVFKDN